MKDQDDLSAKIPEAGAEPPAVAAEEETDRETSLPVEQRGFSDTTAPGASSAHSPEAGTVLDAATSAVTNTGPSS